MDQDQLEPRPIYAIDRHSAVRILLAGTVLVAVQWCAMTSIEAQGQGRDQLPAVPPRERAPDISAAAANIDRDADNLIAAVKFKGNQFVEEYRLNRNIGTRAGRYFDPDLVQQDVDNVQIDINAGRAGE